MRFSKLEGLGNDFIVASAQSVREEDISGISRRICDRQFGVGADGLLLVEKEVASGGADFRMRVFNSDGGEAELSGNGLRCLAAYLFAERLAGGSEVHIRTLAGVKRLKLTGVSGPEYWFEVDMGEPILEKSRIAFQPESELDSLIGCELPVEGKQYRVTVSSMGNPHCSLFVDAFDAFDWEQLGSRIERHPFFPRRTNVEFIRILNRHEIQVRFWERGAGRTLSSGTGSCAATVASVLNGCTERRLTIETLGGKLEIEWDNANRLQLKGPARLICSGEYRV